MVQLHVKKGDESQFLFEIPASTPLADILSAVTEIYNGRLKIDRICTELADLAEHGVSLPPNMQGLTEDQIIELKLVDEWGDRCTSDGDFIMCPDKIGRRNGKAPKQNVAEVISRTISEARELVSKKQATANICLTTEKIKEALDILRGAVMIAYPMGLPPYEPVRMELENNEDLSGTQASREVINLNEASLWWAGKELCHPKLLSDYVGKNDKTKIVAKIQKKGHGAPSREPIVSEDEQKQMMAYYYRKQEEMKKLEEAEDDSYLDSKWADRGELKRQFQGLKDIKWGPR